MRSVSGPFESRNLGHGAWRLSSARAEIYLRIAEGDASEVLQNTDLKALQLDWRDADVIVSYRGAQGISYLEATTVIIHEPKSRVYEGLPLAGFDAAARRFWKRVFVLMRFPGGRFLLRFLTRRQR